MNLVRSTQEIRFCDTLFVNQGLKSCVQVSKAFIQNQVPVAVKIYMNARVEEHQQEIDYLIKLSGTHPSFLHYYGHFCENNCIYIVMEYCEMTLNDLLLKISENELCLQENQVFGLVDTLIHSFAFLENLKILHRDIKPENILIGQNLSVKIIDFSISETMENLESKSETNFHSTIGTHAYMSPELKRFNCEGLTQARFNLRLSDVYSLGIVLLIVLIKANNTNHGLFQQEDFIKNRVKLIENPSYQLILTSMLNQDPSKRKTFQEISSFLNFQVFSLPFGPITSSFFISTRSIVKKDEFFEEQHCLTLMKHDTTCFKFYKDFAPDGRVLAFTLNELNGKVFGIPQLVSAYEEDGLSYVMTENLGFSLKRCLNEWQKHGTYFDISHVYQWFRPIVGLVWNCHQLGFYHNSISDANLFYDSLGQLKISGFSRGWDLRYLPTQEFITACYNHSFTPPEVIQDLLQMRPISLYDYEKADVYALGIVLYQFMTIESSKDIWFNKDNNRLEEKIKNLDSFTAGLLRMMLHNDPSKRVTLTQVVKLIDFS